MMMAIVLIKNDNINVIVRAEVLIVFTVVDKHSFTYFVALVELLQLLCAFSQAHAKLSFSKRLREFNLHRLEL